MLGRTIGRYKITAKLGEGGMGSIWKAEDPLLARTVALKFLSDHLADSSQARRRFLREARAASSLQHPGIATLYDAGEIEGGKLYFAFEYIDGVTVSDLVADGPLEPAEAVRVAAEAAEALHHAHEQGLFHRDISARNIMVARDRRVVVIDFGLARHGDSTALTSSGATLGTVAYLAPEILSGAAADVRSDLYSLAVVLYEMLTGIHPFPGDRAGYRTVHEKPVPPSERRPGLPRALDRFVLKSMAKSPEARHASAAEFAAKLRGLAVRPAPRPVVPPPVDLEAPTEEIKRRASSGKRSRRAVVIVPFRSAAAVGASDPEADAIALGLGTALGAALARLPQITVLPPGEVGVHPGAVRVEGTVRRSGTRVRVEFSLTAHDGRALRGDQVDGTTSDLFALEDALLASVVRLLRPGSRVRPQRHSRAGREEGHERYLLALSYLQKNDSEATIDGAIKLLEELVESEGDTAQIHAALGKAYLQKSRLSLQTEWLRKAEGSCRLALEMEPHSPEVLMTLGRLQLRTGSQEQALHSLERSLALQPRNHEALLLMSQALQSLGRFAEAEQTARAAVELKPDYWLGYQRLGMIYFQQGRYRRTIPEWEQAVALAPDNATVHYNLGAALFQLGRLDDALRSYRRALEIVPNSSAYSGLGTVLFFLGRYPEAITLFEKATLLTPRDPRVWLNLGDAQRWIPGQKSKSAESFDRAIPLLQEQLQTDPESADNWSWLAKGLAKRGRVAESLDAIRRALEIAPGHVGTLARAITVYELAGDRERALCYLQRALGAGYGRVEIERDPELEELRREARAQVMLKDGEPHVSGNESQE